MAKNERTCAREVWRSELEVAKDAQGMNTTSTKVKQTFSFKDAGAHSVLLAADFTDWRKSAIPLKKQRDGVWRVTASLIPGTYHYRFVVDGEWRDDPTCEVRVQNPFGTQNDVVQVRKIVNAEPKQTVPEAARVWGL
jgi:1,4-alpha-glucan branching enzyme